MPSRPLPVPSAILKQRRLPASSPCRPSSLLPTLAKGGPLGRARVARQHTQTNAFSTNQKDHVIASAQDDFHRTASRHVLRGILRECTYFPDPFVAGWIRQHALSRFRTYEMRIWKHRDDESFKKRLETVRRKSRQALYQLRRANEGDRKMLLKALSMAYGRIGKRRRELMYPLLPVEHQQQYSDASNGAEKTVEQPRADPPGAGNHVQHTTAPDKTSSKGRTDGPVKAQIKGAIDDLPRPLCTLVQSQIAASPPTIARRNLRKLGIEIPETNSWHNPMPQVRVKNKLKQWYANILSTVHPPLPDQEWRNLRDLALGVTPFKLPGPRRKQLTTPPSVLEMVVMHGKLPADMFRKDHAHRITPRFMQRLWADVFSQCPLMEYDSQAEKWTVTWGHHVLNDRRVKLNDDAPPATAQPALSNSG
ncbi:hypothetical protein Q7P37_000178 [Cladosporium fusiforme]